jgi:hypothetical protein
LAFRDCCLNPITPRIALGPMVSKERRMRLIEQHGRIAIWEIDGEFYVYGILSDPIVCPSLGMAREKAAI